MNCYILGRLCSAAAIAVCLSLPAVIAAQVTPVAPPAVAATPSPRSPQTAQPSDNSIPSTKTGAVPAPSGPGAPVNSSSYKIGAADVLNIHVWSEPEFSGPVVVHEDGMFTMSLVGDLKAGGLTPVEVEKEVTEALGKYVVKPLVTVTVQEVGSKRYYMDGEISRPGEYTLVVPTTILEAISKAGGIAPFANGKKIYVLRGTQQIKFNLKQVLKGKNMAQNILLKPGDHVIVP